MDTKKDFLTRIQYLNPTLNQALISRAFDDVVAHHKDQMRKSGEPYSEHLIEVAKILTQLGMDSTTVTAGLLHDIVEDTSVTIEDLRQNYNAEVALLVEGATKIKDVKFKTYHEKQADYIRRLLFTMVEDPRVMMIKLADRLHNMRTLEYHDEESRLRIAKETLDIYAPIAHRLGLAEIKWELEDLSFKYLNPDEFQYIRVNLDAKREERERYIQMVMIPVRQLLIDNSIEAMVAGRPKHIYSIYRKMSARHKRFEELDDLYAIRIILGEKKSAVENYMNLNRINERKEIASHLLEKLREEDEQRSKHEITQCYAVLGLVHQSFQYIPATFDDYIASPKSNGYRSLHTTVIGPLGKKVEIQIRTYDLHKVAEFGIAAHWRYKESSNNSDQLPEKLIPWVRELLKVSDDAESSKEFLDELKTLLKSQRIVVFTPKGEALQLQSGSTPIDFAFAVHTEIGLHCRGAKVNGKIVNINHKLNKGDVIEILTLASAKPNHSWLSFAVSSKAKSKIRKSLKEQEFQNNILIGRERFVRHLKSIHVDVPADKNMEELLTKFDCPNGDEFFARIGSGKISVLTIEKFYRPKGKAKKDEDETAAPSALELMAEQYRDQAPVVIDGIDNMMMRIAACCQPVPGDKVAGIITRGRGISIHRVSCDNFISYAQAEPERVIKLAWGPEMQIYLCKILIEARTRRDLMLELTQAILHLRVHVRKNEMRCLGKDFVGQFLLEVHSPLEVKKVIERLKKIEGVERVIEQALVKSKPKTGRVKGA